jgi:hypothetical protein
MVRRNKDSNSSGNDERRAPRRSSKRSENGNDERRVPRKSSKRTENGNDEPSTPAPTGDLQIRNKMVRQLLYAKLKRSKSKAKLKERKSRQQSGEPKQEPKTIEKKRKRDETWVDQTDQETLDDISNDELNNYFTRQGDGTEPKLLLTSQEGFPTSFTNKFLKELGRILPNTTYFQRRHHPIKRIIKKMNTLG